jgi:hypothetical protein
LYKNLKTAIQNSSIPGIPVDIDTYSKLFFSVEGSLYIHPDYIPEKVLAEVEKQMRNTFSFDSRSFGQGVACSEVLSVIQNVNGVVAVDLDSFCLSTESKQVKDIIPASLPVAGSDHPTRAELLTLDSQPLIFNLIQ